LKIVGGAAAGAARKGGKSDNSAGMADSYGGKILQYVFSSVRDEKNLRPPQYVRCKIGYTNGMGAYKEKEEVGRTLDANSRGGDERRKMD